jgi:hypothetical protein
MVDMRQRSSCCMLKVHGSSNYPGLNSETWGTQILISLPLLPAYALHNTILTFGDGGGAVPCPERA